MATWAEALEVAPGPAGLAQARIEAHGLAFLATLRADGSPRLSGVEPLFAMGELWFGMMDGSLKARDLQRDPRFTLHNATVDKQVTEGDVKISGRAVEVNDDDTKRRFIEAFAAASGYPPPDGPMHLFRADVRELATIRPDVDHLVIESWREGADVVRRDRY